MQASHSETVLNAFMIPDFEQLAIPDRPFRHAAALSHLHTANRFRLMFGQPFLEDDPGLPAYREACKELQITPLNELPCQTTSSKTI